LGTYYVVSGSKHRNSGRDIFRRGIMKKGIAGFLLGVFVTVTLLFTCGAVFRLKSEAQVQKDIVAWGKVKSAIASTKQIKESATPWSVQGMRRRLANLEDIVLNASLKLRKEAGEE
jgi:hypothetical protein